MYTKEHVREALYGVLRGAGELWFPAHGLQQDIDLPVDEVWAKLQAALSAQPGLVVCTSGQSSTLPLIPLTERGIELDLQEQEDRDEFKHDLANPTPPRVLAVGIRRFQRDAPLSSASTWTWTWEMMLRCPAMTTTRTPLAWERLRTVGLAVTTAVDLLPPGGDVDEAQAASQARYLQGVLAGLEAADRGYDVVVLLGGKASKAFRMADSRLSDLRLLELRHNFITLPTPHVVEQDGDGWWSSEAKLARLRDVVGKLTTWRCQDCVNGDSDVQGCVECGTHATGCARGEFCVQCRRRRDSDEVAS